MRVRFSGGISAAPRPGIQPREGPPPLAGSIFRWPRLEAPVCVERGAGTASARRLSLVAQCWPWESALPRHGPFLTLTRRWAKRQMLEALVLSLCVLWQAVLRTRARKRRHTRLLEMRLRKRPREQRLALKQGGSLFRCLSLWSGVLSSAVAHPARALPLPMPTDVPPQALDPLEARNRPKR
jgi:hypothetical protein